MKSRQFYSAATTLLLAAASALFVPASACAQESSASDAATALSAALSAACRANEAQFSNYLTTDNAAAFRALPADKRAAFVKRFALTDDPGKPLASTDAEKHTVLRCEATKATVEYRFGDARVHENLAFIPVTVLNSERTEFGLVR